MTSATTSAPASGSASPSSGNADAKHTFTSCAFAGGACTITAGNYALFTLTAPAAAGTQLPFSLALAPNPAKGLPFQFFGFDTANHREGPLLTSGP